ncbi:hypothetical protein BRADI_2g16261v3 [Brachypodium distachyon]|uniref:Epidermal patterning factor-like protein n=1 Tax=Brachypodium distachyon TaxID=15368 RepID=A0A0Q3QTL0_BRADI|nr:hypothetical protein BRADI_2g16261v3 [Brachypodium distachyon]KQK04834.1 hypothetical protein BRADI_2g16261v3 [Brachypodium distachyon]PNT70690.1 hypothetical protein BRADI_2g16261v3 [Brachypodium distachyon]PNT70692.1 hypothetical protein BRADI_2g16261v3 [Brachypodium distachyon]
MVLMPAAIIEPRPSRCAGRCDLCSWCEASGSHFCLHRALSDGVGEISTNQPLKWRCRCLEPRKREIQEKKRG